jgi:hypothetical protein
MTSAPPPGGNPADGGGGAQVANTGGNKFVTIYEALLAAGYNVIPVDAQKRPLAPKYAECYERPCGDYLRETFSKSKRRRTGLALLGRVNPNFPDLILAILDGDRPDKFPQEVREMLRGTWHWMTGPRCPVCGGKDDIRCEGGACRHGGHEFKAGEAPRGEAFAFLIPAEAEKLVGKGILSKKDAEGELWSIRIEGYQLIPPSLHPSGLLYEWAAPPIEDGVVKPPKALTAEEFKRLLEGLGLLEERPQGGQQAAERPQERPKGRRDLPESGVRRVVELLKPAYRPGHRQNIALYLSGWLAKAGVPPETTARIVQQLHAETKDEDPLEQRLGAVVCTYQLAGVADAKKRVETAVGARASGCGEREDNIMGKSGLERELASVLGEDAARRAVAQLGETIEGAPGWLKKLEFKLTQRCLERINGACVKYVKVKARRETVLLRLVSISKRKRKGGEEVVEKETDLALLPRYMAVVHDPYYGEDYYVAYYRGCLLAFAPATNYDAFLQDMRQRPPFFVVARGQVLDLLKSYMMRRKLVISAGLTRSGFADPYCALDLNDYGPEPLKAAYRWVRLGYGERNAKLAWLNVMAAFAKVMTPVIRHALGKDTFNDQIIYNYGRGGEGKSTLARYVLTPMLGGAEALDTYLIRLDGSVKSDSQLRNLLDLNRLPLVLDEQTAYALQRNVPVILSAVVGYGVTGIHAARYGHGIGAKFRNLRGIILFTNVKFQDFLDNVVEETSDYALMRRFLVLTWNFEEIKPEGHGQRPDIKPVYGYAARLWRKYRDELLQAHDLLTLIEKLAGAMEREHPDDAEVKKLAEYTRQVVAEIREEKRIERASLRDDATLLRRAYKFVADELKVSQLSTIKVLRYVLENTQNAKMAFGKPRSGDREELGQRLQNVIERIERNYASAYDPQTGRRLTEDAAVVVSILKSLLEEEKLQAILFAKGKLVEGYPAEFLGAPKSLYVNPYTGQKEHGYAIPLYRFVELFVGADETEEEEAKEART